MDPEREKLLQDLRSAIERAKELQAEYESLSPEERARVDELREEDALECKFLDEIVQRLLDGSMPPDEAELWMAEAEREMEARFGRRIRGGLPPGKAGYCN